MACFNLVDCSSPGSPPMWVTDDILNPTLVVGQIITCNEVQGHCLEVQDGTPPCPTAAQVTGIVVYPDCETCLASLCGCPQGTIQVTLPNGEVSCREDIVVLAEGPAGNGCNQDVLGINQTLVGYTPTLWGPSSQYCGYGARFYGETSGLPWPLTFVTGATCAPGSQQFLDFSSAPVSAIGLNQVNALWGDGTGTTIGPYTGRFNVAGVNPHPFSPCPEGAGGYRGFVYCLNVSTTTTYSIGMGGMNMSVIINGLVFLNANSLQRDIFTYENWNVFQITLPPGNYIIQMTGEVSVGSDNCVNFTFNNPPFANRNPGSTTGLAFEIYQETTVNLANSLLYPDATALSAVTVYSTLDELGKKFDYGDVALNHRCPCNAPVCPTSSGNYNLIVPILDNCTTNSLNPTIPPDPTIYVCHTYEYSAPTTCCYLLTNCDPTASPAYILTSTNFFAELGNVITVAGSPAEPPIIGCFIVSLGQCDGSESAVTLVQSYGPASSGGCAACQPKCYRLTDCEGILPPILVTNNLSTSVGFTIKVCPIQGAGLRETLEVDDFTCCVILTDCCDPTNRIKVICPTPTATGPAPDYFGHVIMVTGLGSTCWKVASLTDPITEVGLCGTVDPSLTNTFIDWSTEYPTIIDHGLVADGACDQCPPCTSICTCYTVEGPFTNCMGAIALNAVISGPYVNCVDCLPKCYELINCEDSNNIIITNTNLAAYLGQVIYIAGCPGTCWTVATALTCVGAVPVIVTTVFPDCATCLGIPPVVLELHPRKIKPGYDTPGCSPEYTERVNCRFGEAMYNHMLVRRYGITPCCREDDQKWIIKKQLLDLASIFDPELCVNLFDICCPPCAVVATIESFNPVQCPAPANAIASIEIPPPACPPPSGVAVAIVPPGPNPN